MFKALIFSIHNPITDHDQIPFDGDSGRERKCTILDWPCDIFSSARVVLVLQHLEETWPGVAGRSVYVSGGGRRLGRSGQDRGESVPSSPDVRTLPDTHGD